MSITKIKKRQLDLVNQILTVDLQDAIVVAQKIADGAVTTSKIADGSVTDGKLAVAKWNASDVKTDGNVTWTSDLEVPTSLAVDSRINSKLAGLTQALVLKGSVNPAGGTINYPANASVGFTYVVSSAGTIGTQVVEPGDTIIAINASAGSYASTTLDSDWLIVQKNIDGAVTSTATSSTDSQMVVFDGATGKVVKASTLTGLLYLSNGVPRAATASDLPVHAHSLQLSDGANNGTVQIDGASGEQTLQIVGSGSVAVTYNDTNKAFTVSFTETQLSVVNGAAVAGQYISAISVNGHEITVTRTDIPAGSNDFGNVSVLDAADTSKGTATADALKDTLTFKEGEGVTMTVAGKQITVAAPHTNRASLDKIPANITATDAGKVFRVAADGTLEMVALNYLAPEKYHVLASPASISGTGNRTVTLAAKVVDNKEMIILNGQVLVRGVDYTIDNSGAASVVTMLFDLITSGGDADTVKATYFEV